MLWGLGVGYVISGMYFGWNLGLPRGGTLGLAIATFFVIILYITFTFSYTELAISIPRAGGAFDYAKEGLGPGSGFLAGMAQIIEFVFAPPAIASAIAAYINLFFPEYKITLYIAIATYLIFTMLNIYGVKAAASFELIITVFAVLELLFFSALTLPHFQWKHISQNPLPNGWAGSFAAIPFALWFFLAIEGIANVAEETVHPQKNVLIGFGSAIITLIILCLLTFFSAIGVAGWQAIVYPAVGQPASDSPLPLALSKIVHRDHLFYHLLVTIGLFGLVASFHGIILAAGRATYEFGKSGFGPRFLGNIHERFHTPAHALVANMFIGILALFTGKTAEIITIACFGALSLYILSMLSLFALRRKRPNMLRPFKVPFYPIFPGVAVIIATVCLLAMCYYNRFLALTYFSILSISFFLFRIYQPNQEA